MKKSSIELWRFIASICILLSHSNMLGYDSFRFQTAGIYVNFFFIGLLLMLYDVTFTSCIKSKILNYLGKLSMIIFITHPLVAKILHYFNQNSILLFVGISLIVAELLCEVIDRNNKLSI